MSHFRKLSYAHAEHTRKRFYRMLSILGTDFIAHWAYKERISAHAQPAVKCELFYMYNLCWAFAERILSHTEHTWNEFHCMLSILGTDFITCWACVEMFKSRLSLPIWIRFLKISCYRPLGPNGFGFCKKSQKKISCLCKWFRFLQKKSKKKFHACVPLKQKIIWCSLIIYTVCEILRGKIAFFCRLPIWLPFANPASDLRSMFKCCHLF